MYSKNFVVSIKDKDGKILREAKGGTVYLPFNSEYSIYLKNNHDRRALASIMIDGTDVLNGEKIVVNARSSVTLERFLIDGDISSGKKFLFVEETDSRVQDPTNSQNGGIVVRFYLEKNSPIPINKYTYTSWDTQGTTDNQYHALRRLNKDTDSINTYGAVIPPTGSSFCSTSFSLHDSMIGCHLDSIHDSQMKKGATVEGSTSNQRFARINDLQVEDNFTEIRMQILPVRNVTYNSSNVFCAFCGEKNEVRFNFCTKCGQKLIKNKTVVEATY